MKTSKKQQDFETGAKRDNDDMKGNPSLISPIATYRRAILLQKGAKHYGPSNWQKGMPFTRTADSIYRHLIQWLAGDTSEDHLAAIGFGSDALMHFEAGIAAGELPDSLDDRNVGMKKTFEHFLTSQMGDTTIPQKGQLKNTPYCCEGHRVFNHECSECMRVSRMSCPSTEEFWHQVSRCCGIHYYAGPGKNLNDFIRPANCRDCGRKLNYV